MTGPETAFWIGVGGAFTVLICLVFKGVRVAMVVIITSPYRFIRFCKGRAIPYESDFDPCLGTCVNKRKAPLYKRLGWQNRFFDWLYLRFKK
jgi:hypothetical protein